MLMILLADKKMQKIVDNPSSISKYSPQKFEKLANRSSWSVVVANNGKDIKALTCGNESIRYSLNGTRFDATHFYGNPYWIVNSSKGKTRIPFKYERIIMDKEEKLRLIRFMYDLAVELSKPYEMQYIEMEDFARWNLPDEMGLVWDDATGMINNIQYECILPMEVISILREIRQNFLDAFELEETSYKEIWSHEAMKNHPFWTGQRNLAKKVAESISVILYDYLKANN